MSVMDKRFFLWLCVADRHPGIVSSLYGRMREFAAELKAKVLPIS